MAVWRGLPDFPGGQRGRIIGGNRRIIEIGRNKLPADPTGIVDIPDILIGRAAAIGQDILLTPTDRAQVQALALTHPGIGGLQIVIAIDRGTGVAQRKRRLKPIRTGRQTQGIVVAEGATTQSDLGHCWFSPGGLGSFGPEGDTAGRHRNCRRHNLGSRLRGIRQATGGQATLDAPGGSRAVGLGVLERGVLSR